MMNYVVGKNNPFKRKAKECFHVNSRDFACLQCQAYEQANAPEHADCFMPRTIEWLCAWKRFDDVQRMLPVR